MTTYRRWIAPWMAAGLLIACGSDASSAPEGAGSRPSAEPAVNPTADEAPAVPAPPSPAPALPPLETRLDLMGLVELADVYAPSLQIDFGSPARLKYTNGSWRSGWGADGERGGETFTNFARMGKVYFPIDTPRALRLRVRIRAEGAERLMPFLNGEPLAASPLDRGAGFVDLDLDAPAALVRSGENYLLLRADGVRRVDGEEVSASVASIRVGSAAELEAQPTAVPRPRIASIRIDEEDRVALPIGAGTRLSWYLELPAGRPELAFSAASLGAADATLALHLRAEGSEVELRQEIAAAPRWQEHRVDLSSLAGALVRLDLELPEGAGGLALAGLRIGLPARPPPAPLEAAQNVILLVIDTLRADKLRVYDRSSRVRAPALDRFASEGALFENAQAPENWTKPSVASILTSLHPETHRTQLDASRLPASALMIGEVLQRSGFETAGFIANGYVSDAFGFGRGWDHYTNYIRETRNTNASNVFSEALEWIEAHREGRFFAYIQTIDPHVPYDPPDEFLRLYDASEYHGQVTNRRTHLLLEEAKRNPPTVTFDAADRRRIVALHDGEISYHDHHFARFVERLGELGLAENTVFVITSDHGEEFMDHGSWGHGHSVYQELLHVPLILRWPAGIEAGQRVAPVVSTLDVSPTILAALGLPIPEAFEGQSLLGHARGEPPPGPHVAFSYFQDNRRVIRGGDWKLIIRGNLTYTLFDLGSDPDEERELRPAEHPIAMRYLRILSGHFLGASDRGRWLRPGPGAAGASGGAGHAAERGELTVELCEQLAALGYASAECAALLEGQM